MKKIFLYLIIGIVFSVITIAGLTLTKEIDINDTLLGKSQTNNFNFSYTERVYTSIGQSHLCIYNNGGLIQCKMVPTSSVENTYKEIIENYISNYNTRTSANIVENKGDINIK